MDLPRELAARVPHCGHDRRKVIWPIAPLMMTQTRGAGKLHQSTHTHASDRHQTSINKVAFSPRRLCLYRAVFRAKFNASDVDLSTATSMQLFVGNQSKMLESGYNGRSLVWRTRVLHVRVTAIGGRSFCQAILRPDVRNP